MDGVCKNGVRVTVLSENDLCQIKCNDIIIIANSVFMNMYFLKMLLAIL